MAAYSAPGVYVEEVPAAVTPIAGVGTSTAGFIGLLEYQEVAPTAAALTGSILYEDVTVVIAEAADTPLERQTAAAIVAALQGTDKTTVQVAGAVAATVTNLQRKLLRERITDPQDATRVIADVSDTPLSRTTAQAIVTALRSTDKTTVQIEGAVAATVENLDGMRLREHITQTAQKGTTITPALAAQLSAAPPGAPATVKLEPLIPAGQPKLCTNFSEFTKNFGSFAADVEHNRLVHAVYGFFNNGGTHCWVTRVSRAGATDATALNGKLIAALDAFKPLDDIALVAIPGATDAAVQSAMLDHCENASLQNRFAILDGKPQPATLTPMAIQDGVRHSSYGAIYFPWLQVFDPVSNRPIFVPPSGHLAGLYARVDSSRGVHKAPANEVIRGALDVQVAVSKRLQAGLNPNGVNVMRTFNGNVTVWGARTWADPTVQPEWKYINVRRLFLFLRQSIDRGMQWVVFEPNEPGLWAKITRNITAFLTNVWQAGALVGATPQEAFYVKCDAGTNPPELRDLGQVVTEIGVAVVQPAEFVIFRMSQWSGPGSA